MSGMNGEGRGRINGEGEMKSMIMDAVMDSKTDCSPNGGSTECSQPSVNKEKRHYITVGDDMRKVITEIYNNTHGAMNIKEVAKILGIREDTLRRLRRRLQKGESIERSKVRRGRHTKVSQTVAADLDEMFLDKCVHSDKEASQRLKEMGISVSRQAIQRALTNGLMEKYGFDSLMMERVCEECKEAIPAYLDSVERGYHPVFVDETRWRIGWVWSENKSMNNRSHMFTVVSILSERGAECIISLESPALVELVTNRIHRDPEEKEVFVVGGASLNDLKKRIGSVKNKELICGTFSCNSIESFFADWKQKVEKRCTSMRDPGELLGIIEESFRSFSVEDCAKLVRDVVCDLRRSVYCVCCEQSCRFSA